MWYFFAPWTIGRRYANGNLYVAPHKAEMVFDFTPEVGASAPVALFRGNVVPPDGEILGRGPDGKADLSAVSAVLGEGLDVPSNASVLEVLFALVTQNGDPMGRRQWKPIQPDLSGQLRVQEGSAAKAEQFNPGRHPLVLDSIREDYQRVRQGGGPSGKFLTVLAHKLRVRPEVISPDTPVPSDTIFTESFDVAGGGSLGPDQTWGEFWTPGPLWRVNVDQAAELSEFGDSRGEPARADAQLSSTDMRAHLHIERSSEPGSGGTSARFAGVTLRHGTQPNYISCVWYESGDGAIFNDTFSGSTRSRFQLARQQVSGTRWQDFEIEGRVGGDVIGSQIRLYVGGIHVLSATSSAHSGNLRGGMVSQSKWMHVDRWELSDEFPPTIFPKSRAVVIS